MAVINSYYLYQKYEKRGNQPWIPCYPNTWSVDADGTMPPVLKQQDDPSCYHPIYRWVQTQDTICIDTTTIEYRTTSGDPYCNGYDKYVDTTYEQSFDGGVTWEFVSSSSTLIEQDSEDCGYVPPTPTQYRWTESGTTCDNANKYKRYIKEVSYDGGYAWIVVTPPQYSAGTLVEADSYDCGYRTSATTSATYCSNANQYADVYSLVSRDYGVTWSTASTSTELIEEDVVECGFSARTISTATTCVGVDKHYLDEYQESRDTGTTWTTISSSTGSLIESQSTDCGYSATTVSSATYCSNANQYVDVYSIVSTDYGRTWTTASTSTVLVDSDVYECGYRTGTTTGTPYCDGYDKYVDVYYRTSRDSGTTWTTASTTPTLVEAQSEDCGYVPPTPTQYRWTESGTTCIGYDKYQNNIKEQSTDGGETWTVVIPEEYSASTLIESQSTDCGYVPPTPTGAKFAVTLTNSSAITAACDSTSAITSAETSDFRRYILTATIGDCVTEIGPEAFSYGLGYLPITSLTLSNSVTTLRNNAFHFSSLYDVDLKNVTTLWNGCFSGSHNLSSVTMSNVVDIKADAFWLCDNLVRVNSNVDGVINIPSTVASIGRNPFANCPLITSVTVDSSNTVYDSRNNCNAVIKTSSNALIIGCKNTVIPNTVRSIGSWAFRGYDISNITLPNGITTIGSGAFEGTTLTSITIPDSVTYINSDAFRGCINLEGLSIGSGVTTINQYAFSRCFSLTSVTIPNNVTFIGKEAFYHCTGLTSVTLGSSVDTIGDNGFINCTSLQSITCLATRAASLGSSVFDGTNDCPIYVPSGSVNDYKAVWSSYSSRIQAIPNS